MIADAREAGEAGRTLVRSQGRRIETLARLGYGGRALVFLIVAVFALRAALASGSVIGTEGAIRTVVGTTFGVPALALLALALAGFALWRIVYAAMDPDRRGSGAKGIAIRLASLVGAAIYGALALSTARLALGLAASSGDKPYESLVKRAFEAGYGLWLTYAVALALAVVGAIHVGRGLTRSFEKTVRLPAASLPWLRWVCQTGLVARGIVFLILAWLLWTGASSISAGDAPATEDALSALLSWPYGHWLLAALAVGLVAFAVFGFAQARYRRIDVENA